MLAAGWNAHFYRAVPLEEMQPWVDDALDLIEFANGDTSTVWGRKRTEFGHAEPFGLEYIAIGNEEVGDEFFERYPILHKAIREKYPNIKIINSSGPFSEGGEYEKGWKSAKENQSDLVDEHYYASPEWFLANQHRYDNFKRDDPKVFLGEYASWGNTYYNALVEASYMIGLERNAHAVALACYAPMLCNVDYVNWKPDMLWFNNNQVFGTPNYYVQKLFMNHQGDHLLDISSSEMPESIMMTEEPDRLSGNIKIVPKEATIDICDITLMNDDTKEIKSFANCIVDKDNKEVSLQYVDWKNFTLKMKVTKKDGPRGFALEFGKKDDKNSLYWVIGGWQNQDCIIAESIDGRTTDLSQYKFTCEKNKEYQLELKIRGRNIKTFINGQAYNNIDSKPIIIEPLYYSASKEDKSGDLIIKVVNVSDQSKTATIELQNCDYSQGKVYIMENYDLNAENDFVNPTKVIPVEKAITINKSIFEYEIEKHSIYIFRLSTFI